MRAWTPACLNALGRAHHRWRDETGDTHALAAARVAVGVLLLDASVRAADELRLGYFGEVFHWPIVPEALVPSKAIYMALLGLEALCGLLVVAGFRARRALAVSAWVSTFVLLCDRLQFHHNRWALACDALLLSWTPCDQWYALARSERARSRGDVTLDPSYAPQTPDARPGRRGLLWAARLAQVQVSIVYLASGGSKLLDADWRNGRVLATRVALYGHNALAAGVPAWVVDGLREPSVAGLLAKLAIATELFLAVGLWPKRTRAFALWWGVWFHLTIEATSRVEGFTWLTLAMYALFATPDARARTLTYDPSRPGPRVVARVVRWLDWLARFDVRVRTDADEKGDLVVIDRTGSPVIGLRAIAAIARATPVLFPLWLPLAAMSSMTPSTSPQ